MIHDDLLDYLRERLEHAKLNKSAVCERFSRYELARIVAALELQGAVARNPPMKED